MIMDVTEAGLYWRDVYRRRALEILFLQEETRRNYPDAENKIDFGITSHVLAVAFWPKLEIPDNQRNAQYTLDTLERNGLLQNGSDRYRLTSRGLRVCRRLFGEFETYGDLLEGARCYFDVLCAERKGGGWRLL
ncbi:MAG: hypothetical protein HYU56_05705 [Candidatus Aenigmarchaeota archaeon]|nr:hypothetical protein [Candidatus Aenigmarchaeota archaeon]